MKRFLLFCLTVCFLFFLGAFSSNFFGKFKTNIFPFSQILVTNLSALTSNIYKQTNSFLSKKFVSKSQDLILQENNYFAEGFAGTTKFTKFSQSQNQENNSTKATIFTGINKNSMPVNTDYSFVDKEIYIY